MKTEERLRIYLDQKADGLHIPDASEDGVVNAVRGRARLRVWQRPMVAVTLAASVIVLLVAGFAWLIAPEDGEERPVATIPATPVVTEAPPVVTEAPLPTALPPASTDPTPTTEPSADDGIDYSVFGAPVATMDTPVGTLSWVHSDSVPMGWLTLGFPFSTSYPDGLLDMFSALPCCLELFHDTNDFLWVGPWSGVPEQPLPSSYVALGPTGDSDERRAATSEYRGRPTRIRGLEENEDPYAIAYAADNVGGADIRKRVDEGALALEWFNDGVWRPDHVVAPVEVWYSADGHEWALMSESGLGPDTAVESQPYSVAQRDGRWVVIGWSGVSEGQLFAHGIPSVWVSDDLTTWTKASGAFGKQGMITRLTSVIASDDGWLLFGIHSTVDSPRRAEWGAWASRDGRTWEEIPIHDLFGEPSCGATPVRGCWVTPAFTPDGRLAAYLWEEDRSSNPARGWTLWLATWEQ